MNAVIFSIAGVQLVTVASPETWLI